MKILSIQILALLFLCTPVLANNGGGADKEAKSNKSENATVSLNNIFFTDSENEVLFIDFEVVRDNIKAVNVTKDGKMMLIDDVSDVSSNDIYELNFGIFRAGTYTIEIVTEQDIIIQKRITID